MPKMRLSLFVVMCSFGGWARAAEARRDVTSLRVALVKTSGMEFF